MAKTTVALTPAADEAADVLESFKLPERAHLVRLGFAYALRAEFDLERASDFGNPSNNHYTASVATLDPDQKIADLINAYYEKQDDPYYALETLANKGLVAIGELIASGEIGSLSDLLDDSEPIS